MHKPPLSWKLLKEQIIDFRAWDESVGDIFRNRRSLAISGPPGVGKSTLLIWAIGSALENDIPRWFDSVVFLNPNSYQDWSAELREFDPQDTLLVIDGLFRVGDVTDEGKLRTEALINLTQHQDMDGETVGPFCVAVTLRHEEYASLTEWSPRHSIEEISVGWDRAPLSRILEKRLSAWGIKLQEGINILDLEEQLRERSEGIPLYLEYLASEIAEQGSGNIITNPVLTREQLRRLPKGVVSLIWQILSKNCSDIESDATLFLIKLLSDCTGGISEEFFNYAIEALCQPKEKSQARRQIRHLGNYYLLPDEKVVREKRRYKLSGHWITALREGLTNTGSIDGSYQVTVDRYRAIDVESKRSELCGQLYERLGHGIRSASEAMLISDLVVLGAMEASSATNAWLEARKTAPFLNNPATRTQLDLLIYDTWVKRAVESKHTRQLKSAEEGFEMALSISASFDTKSRLEHEMRPLHGYIIFLRRFILPDLDGEEFVLIFNKIEGLYDRLTLLDESDRISWLSKADFYFTARMFGEEAVCLQKASELQATDPLSELITYYAYAVCFTKLGDAQWMSSPSGGERCYDLAREKFESARSHIDRTRNNVEMMVKLNDEGKVTEFERLERKLLNAYATLCIEQARKKDELSDKSALDENASELFEEALKKYPRHVSIIHKYADFLLKYGWSLERFKGSPDSHVLKAKEILESAISGAEQRNENPDPTTLHMLGRLFYRYDCRPDFKHAEELLLKSAEIPDRGRQVACWHELGKLYIEWAKSERLGGQTEDSRLQAARGALNKAADIEPVPGALAHLIRVYQTCARLDLLTRDFDSVEREWEIIQDFYRKRRSKGIEPLHQLIADIGDEFFEERDWPAAKWCFEKATALPRSGWYQHSRLGRCYYETGDYDLAYKECLKSVELSQNAAVYSSARNTLYWIEKAERARNNQDFIESGRAALYREKRLAWTEKAYSFDPNNWQNCVLYGEDLRQTRNYSRAFDILQEAHERLKASVRYDKKQKTRRWSYLRRRAALSRVYWNLGKTLNWVGKRNRARRYVRLGAKLDNRARSWRELVEIECRWHDRRALIAAYESWSASLQSTTESKWNEGLNPTRFREILRSVYHAYSSEKRVNDAAVAGRYYAALYWLTRQPQEKMPAHRAYAEVGRWLLSNIQIDAAIECFLNAFRITPDSSYKIMLAEAATLQDRLVLATKLHEQVENSDTSAPSAPDVGNNPHELGLASTPLDEIEEIILEETSGNNEFALERYRKLANDLFMADSQSGMIDSHKVRLIADGLLVLGRENPADVAYARRLYNLLKDCARWPEKFYLSYLYRAISA